MCYIRHGRTTGYFPKGTIDIKKFKNTILIKDGREVNMDVEAPELPSLLCFEETLKGNIIKV